MGLESRDYIRDSSPRSGFGFRPGGDTWAVKYLIIANIVVFLLQMLSGYPQQEGATRWLDLRLATAVGPDATPFYEVTRKDGRFPRQLVLPVEGTEPDEVLDPGTTLQPFNEGYGRFRVVEWRGRYGIVPAGSLHPAPLKSWQLFWRLITHGFCHGSLTHLAFNMIALYFFGRLLEPIYGSKEFLLFYLCGVIVAGLGHLLLLAFTGENNPAVGASGGVMAVVFVAAMIYPRMKVLLFMVIPIELRLLAIGVVAFDLFGLVQSNGWHIAHAAHLGGAAFGVAYKYFNWRISGGWGDLMNRFRLWQIRRRSKVRLYQPDEPPRSSNRDDADVSRRVDDLLEKISKHGEGSLTDSEREFLAEASRRYRDR